MRDTLKRHWPLIIAIGTFWIVVALWLMFSLSLNQGHLVYSLDDTYLHMAIAKNFAQHGIWGMTRYAFSSSSSSLLWTLLLSVVYLLFGVNEVAPFILNLIFATLLICLVYSILKRYKLNSFFSIIVLWLIIFLAPLPSLIFCGLEHILHIFLTIVFVYLVARTLSNQSSEEKKPISLNEILLLVLSPLIVMTRYEALFLVFVVCLLFVVRQRLRYSLLLGGLGILPVVIFGLISLSKGGYFLPNSILLKGKMPSFSSLQNIINFFGYSGYYQLLLTPHILFFIIVGSIVFILLYNKPDRIWSAHSIMIIVFIATTLLHMQFSKIIVVEFMRYEAYLIGLGIFVISIALQEYFSGKFWLRIKRDFIPKYLAIGLLIILVIFPLAKILVKRGLTSLIKTPRATTNIYQQQYQMGLFLREFYQDTGVAAHDLGAINFLSDVRCLDLWGLASVEVTKKKREGEYDREKISELAKSEGTRIAIVYADWFRPGGRLWAGVRPEAMPVPSLSGIPSQWIKVGEWKIQNNVICNRNTVSFYAVEPKEANNLMENLRAFSDRLPESIFQTGLYCDRYADDKHSNL